ncbi:MAG TPA: M61 family peptidase, partial [Verrucomicrobiae bacterium]
MEAQPNRFGLFTAALFLAGTAARAENAPIQLNVDATDAPRQLLHAQLHIPATPGPLTLFYPKWIPGEHLPGGPINNVTGLKFSANGQPLDWQRDAEDMFAFHLIVPAGADAVDVALDFLPNAGGGAYSDGVSSTPQILDLSWNQLLLYPTNTVPLQLIYRPTLNLPSGWKFGTALPIASVSSGQIAFAPVPLETLVDSPVMAGEYLHTVALTPDEPAPHFIHIAADNEADLDKLPPDREHFPRTIRMVHETEALFGARHFRSYHFLLTCSDHLPHFGLEHHESSDDRVGEDYLTDDTARKLSAALLPHEMIHSWNGKYRRPAGLATPNFQQPMRDELLWVYEGLTSYYGNVVATRCGYQTNEDYCMGLAQNAAMLDHRSGRHWRSLADTTISASMLYSAAGAGINRRRGVDFYSEGDLIWLAADVRIRQQTHGARSLDDFARHFFGGNSGAPKVVPYVRADVENALNDIAPGDWHSFFQQRIYEITPHAPLDGITNSGWRLAYTNEVPELLKALESHHKFTDLNYSLGFSLGSDGGIGEILPGSPADRAGIVSGMKLIAVNERAWSAEIVRAAVRAAVTNSAAIALLVENNDYYKTFELHYHGGEKYPVLQRDP